MAAFDLPINDFHLSALFQNHSKSNEDESKTSGMKSAMERSDSATSSTPSTTATATRADTMATSRHDPEELSDFLHNVPPVVIRLLVELGPFLSYTRWALQVASWKSGLYAESWLALSLLWSACLAFRFTIRYLLPIIIIAPYIISPILARIRPHESSKSHQASTETTLRRSLADVSSINHHLPRVPNFKGVELSPVSSARLIIVSYCTYATVVYLVPPTIVIGSLGTILLTWRAPWARTIRYVVSSNGWARYLSRRAWQVATGTTPSYSSSSATSGSAPSASTTAEPQVKIASSLKVSTKVDLPPPSAPLRFRFTVLENQRWWVGLDWTAALLPSERASWTSLPPALRAVAPPMAMTLPPTKSVWLPVAGKGTDHLRIKRTATWSWDTEHPSWAVVVRLKPTSTPERVVMALPKLPPLAPPSAGAGGPGSPEPASGMMSPTSATGPEGFLQRGLQRFGTSVDLGGIVGSAKAQDQSGGRSKSPETAKRRRFTSRSDDSVNGRGEGVASEDTVFDDEDDEHGADGKVEHATETEDIGVTDAEGWIYGDNKWEGASGKGGIGKFTRYRRWTRNAILTETVEVVPAEDDPAYRPPAPASQPLAPTTSASSNKSTKSPAKPSSPSRQPPALSTQHPPSLLGKGSPSPPAPSAPTLISISPTASPTMALPPHIPEYHAGSEPPPQPQGLSNENGNGHTASSPNAVRGVGSSLKQRLQHVVGVD